MAKLTPVGLRYHFGKNGLMKGFYIFCISSINCFENELINFRYTILDSTNILEILIFPSSVTFLILHKLVMLFSKFPYICNFCDFYNIFINIVIKSKHLIRQTAILTPFREATPATPHFDILGIKPEYFDKLKVI